MINNTDLINVAMYTLKSIEVNDKVSFKTFKKDRGFTIEKIEGAFNIIEDGYEKKEFLNIKYKEVKKILKELQKKEFPRSNKIWYKIIRGNKTA